MRCYDVQQGAAPPVEGQPCALDATAAHLAAVTLPAHAARLAVSPCGHFVAVSTADETVVLGLRTPPALAAPASPGSSLSGGADPEKARVCRVALPAAVPAAAALCFGCPSAARPKAKGKKGAGKAAEPAFRLFVADALGRVVMIQAGTAQDSEVEVETIHAFEAPGRRATGAAAPAGALLSFLFEGVPFQCSAPLTGLPAEAPAPRCL